MKPHIQLRTANSWRFASILLLMIVLGCGADGQTTGEPETAPQEDTFSGNGPSSASDGGVPASDTGEDAITGEPVGAPGEPEGDTQMSDIPGEPSPGEPAPAPEPTVEPDTPDTSEPEADVPQTLMEGNHAVFVSQEVPTQVNIGGSFTATVTLRNMGTTSWSKADGHFLGSENPQDNFTWSTNRMEMDNDVVVPPWETYTFSKTLSAPSEEGSYDFQWGMLQDAVEWFGELSDNVSVEVVVPEWTQYPTNPYVIDLKQPQEEGEIRGSLFAHDLNGDELMDFVVTGPDVVGAYDHDGGLLWKVDDDIHLPGAANGGENYPGTHAPGAIAGDMDGDGASEVAYVTFSGQVKIRDGATGDVETTHSFPGAEAMAIANLSGNGDRDAVLQYGQQELRAIALETGETLWHKTDWFGIEHSQVRVVDVNGDGLDEVVGPVFLNASGGKMNGWNLQSQLGTALGGLDSLAIGDIVPGGPLEIAMAEQGGNNQTVMVNHQTIYWGVNQNPGAIGPSGQCVTEKDPDKMAVGDFDPGLPGLEVFARSACSNHPWVHSSEGNIIASWNLPETAPAGWLHYDGDKEYGIEEIWSVDWEGGAKHHLLLKERQVEGKAAIVDAMSGSFVQVFDVNAARVYGADVSGDFRDEAIVLSSNGGVGRIEIFWNEASALSDKPSPWENQAYRRTRQNWNYYSP